MRKKESDYTTTKIVYEEKFENLTNEFSRVIDRNHMLEKEFERLNSNINNLNKQINDLVNVYEDKMNSLKLNYENKINSVIREKTAEKVNVETQHEILRKQL